METSSARSLSPTARLLGIVCLSLLLAACLGGDGNNNNDGNSSNDGSSSNDDTGSSTSPSGEPSLSLTLQSIKTLAFSWEDVADETEYRLLENADGISGYTQIASIAADATSHELEVFLPGRINASYILQACNSDGCSDSAEVFVDTNLADAVGYVKASNTGEGDEFGYSVALTADGKTLAVGAHRESGTSTGIDGADNDDALYVGAVYVFSHDGSSWSQQAYVKASNATARQDRFGFSVALAADGNTLAVGAPREASGATGINGEQDDSSALESGAVYVFSRSGTSWSQQAYVKGSKSRRLDRFGGSVALAGDGNTLAVGASGDDQIANASGAVYVFSRSGTSWSEQDYLKASTIVAGFRFGSTVTLDATGDTLAVGSDSEDSDATGINGDEDNREARNSGAVYVFSRSGTNWSQQAFVKASNTAENARFGSNVDLSDDGNTLAVGATYEGWTSVASVGAGAVYVFVRSGTTWSEQAYLKASNTDDNDRFGWGVALAGNGDTLAVGAYLEDSVATNSGAVYLFNRSGTSWSQQAYLKAPNAEQDDSFGLSVALAADGNTLAVGAHLEGSSATGIGGDQADNSSPDSGAVYLY